MGRYFPLVLVAFGLGGLTIISSELFLNAAQSVLKFADEQAPVAVAEPASPPRGFGMRGMLGEFRDGKTDCTEALQAIVNSDWGRIRLAKGIYRISKPIEIDLAKVGFTSLEGGGVSQIVMAGPGPAFRLIGSHAGTAAPNSVKPNVWTNERTPMIDGIEVVGDHPEADGIEATGTMQLTISRTVVRKARHGIRLTGRNRNVIISDCHIYENNGIGVFLDHLNLHQINIANSHISYNRLGGIVSRFSEIRNLQIGVCDIEGNMGGLEDPAAANIELDARETSLGEVTIVGCTIQHGHRAYDSANIRINGHSIPTRGTEEVRHSNITIADNIISDVQVNLDIRNIRGVTITGNTISQGFERNLLLENCSNIVVANNVFERSPRYRSVAFPKQGVLIKQSSDTIFASNVISGEVPHQASLHVSESKRINITGCNIVDYSTVGLLLENVTDSRVSDCILLSDNPEAKAGLQQVDSQRVLLSDNLEKDTTFPEN